jgi:hypothetical protein
MKNELRNIKTSLLKDLIHQGYIRDYAEIAIPEPAFACP